MNWSEEAVCAVLDLKNNVKRDINKRKLLQMVAFTNMKVKKELSTEYGETFMF